MSTGGSGTSHELVHRVQRSIDRTIGALPPRVARGIARDRTSTVTNGRLMVLAPHPDDETLACGVTIQRTLDRGNEVTVVVASDGRYGDPESVVPERMATIRKGELARATAVLGVSSSHLIMLGFEDATLSDHEDALAESIQEIIEINRPDVVISPCPWDLHPDHAALGRVARTIVEGRSVLHLEYLVWGWDQPVRLAIRLGRRAISTRGSWTFPALPVVVDGTGYLDGKAEALACHSSQFSPTAVLHGRSVGGSGPLGSGFLRLMDYESELFFPRSTNHRASANVERQTC